MTQYIDLTHTLHDAIPAWDLSCNFRCKTVYDYKDSELETKFRVQKLETPAGIGTHIDLPAHCFPGAMTVDQLPIDECRKPCVVINISSKALNENFLLSRKDIEDFENAYAQIAKDTFVIINTGWSKYWDNPKQYHNNLIFPSVSAEAAECLLEKGISGLGIDTLSPDAGDSDFEVHRIILGANKIIIENIANAHLMPEMGAELLILPLKIKEGTESPIRLIGIVS